MNPTNPLQPVSAPQVSSAPIQDVIPASNSLGNPENITAEPAPNPIAGTAAPQSSIIHEQPVGDQALDSVLANVSNNIKAAPPPPAKKGFFGGSKQPKQPKHAPGQPISQPLAPGPTKSKAKKPVLVITVATLAGIGLAAAAIVAYK